MTRQSFLNYNVRCITHVVLRERLQGNLDVLDQVLNRLRKTKRPEKEELLELLAEVGAA